jgi:quinol monooxygenase YgiN
MIHVDATVEISEESQKILLPVMRKAMAATALEEGCLVFRFTADLSSPTLFYMSELWASEAALMAHMQLPSFQDSIGILMAHAKVLNMVTRQGELAPYELALPA